MPCLRLTVVQLMAESLSMKIVTSSEMREIDRITSERFGVPSLTLMENAGIGCGGVCALMCIQRSKVSALSAVKETTVGMGSWSHGNCMKRAGKYGCCCWLILSELRGMPRRITKARQERPKGAHQIGSSTSVLLRSPRLALCSSQRRLIDAILGTGFRPPVSGLYAQAIAKINGSNAPVIAVDIPSGADADVMGNQTGAVARADAIVTFTAPRPAHVFGDLTSGPTIIAPIGSPDEAIQSSLNLNLITAKDIAPLIAPRPRDSNKGMYGHVLVVGGSLGKAGAAAMAGFSALRAGAGLVTVATPKSVLPTVAGFHPELMTEPLEETQAGTIALNAVSAFAILAKNKTVLAIGPGISRNHETSEFVRAIVRDSGVPVVLDADGLNAFEGRAKDLNRKDRKDVTQDAKNTRLVLTPHPGEMARLTGLSTAAIQRDRINVAREFARGTASFLSLKATARLSRIPMAKPG